MLNLIFCRWKANGKFLILHLLNLSLSFFMLLFFSSLGINAFKYVKNKVVEDLSLRKVEININELGEYDAGVLKTALEDKSVEEYRFFWPIEADVTDKAGEKKTLQLSVVEADSLFFDDEILIKDGKDISFPEFNVYASEDATAFFDSDLVGQKVFFGFRGNEYEEKIVGFIEAKDENMFMLYGQSYMYTYIPRSNPLAIVGEDVHVQILLHNYSDVKDYFDKYSYILKMETHMDGIERMLRMGKMLGCLFVLVGIAFFVPALIGCMNSTKMLLNRNKESFFVLEINGFTKERMRALACIEAVFLSCFGMGIAFLATKVSAQLIGFFAQQNGMSEISEAIIKGDVWVLLCVGFASVCLNVLICNRCLTKLWKESTFGIMGRK